MIVHFFEVWLLVVMTFIIGCVLGAFIYGILANSGLAVVQGTLADGIGDTLDGIKVRFGIGPAWRARQMGGVARPLPASETLPELALPLPDEYDEEEDIEEFELPPLPPPPPPRPSVTQQTRTVAIVPRPQLSRPAERVREPLQQGDEPAFVGGDPARVASAQQVGRDGVVPMRPAGLAAPRGGVPDNLTRVRGIGHRNEELLNSLGIFHFGQIAAWTPGEVRWIGQYLAFPERIERDDWVGQAITLASGTETGFVKSAERRRQHRRQLQQERAAREAAARQAAFVEETGVPPHIPINPLPPRSEDELARQVREARRKPVEDDDWSIDESFEDFIASEPPAADKNDEPDTER